MAIIKDPILGNLSGRIGDLVFKQRYGKTVVYYMPKKQKKNIRNEESETSLLQKIFNKRQRNQKP
ncbi:MAG: hypothetical protein WCK13_00030 [Ignavibacteriota bacterium]